MVTAATGALTFGLGTVCLATVGGVNLFGLSKAEPAHAVGAAVTDSTLGAPGETVVVTTAPGVPVTDAAGTPVTDPAGVVITTPAPTVAPPPVGFAGGPAVPTLPGMPTYATTSTTHLPGTPTTSRVTTTTARPGSPTTRPPITTAYSPGTNNPATTESPYFPTTTPTTLAPTTLPPTTQAPTTTAKPIVTTTTKAPSTQLYSVTGVPLPPGFSIPSGWPKNNIPNWPAGCRNGQLEDNGKWNCQ
jgi:hypothetical protein